MSRPPIDVGLNCFLHTYERTRCRPGRLEHGLTNAQLVTHLVKIEEARREYSKFSLPGCLSVPRSIDPSRRELCAFRSRSKCHTCPHTSSNIRALIILTGANSRQMGCLCAFSVLDADALWLAAHARTRRQVFYIAKKNSPRGQQQARLDILAFAVAAAAVYPLSFWSRL